LFFHLYQPKGDRHANTAVKFINLLVIVWKVIIMNGPTEQSNDGGCEMTFNAYLKSHITGLMNANAFLYSCTMYTRTEYIYYLCTFRMYPALTIVHIRWTVNNKGIGRLIWNIIQVRYCTVSTWNALISRVVRCSRYQSFQELINNSFLTTHMNIYSVFISIHYWWRKKQFQSRPWLRRPWGRPGYIY
jgi:hypothetical protein